MQNNISKQFLNGSNLQDREEIVLEDASKKLSFTPIKIIRRSSWWNSKQIGAFHCQGIFNGINTILKIQGVKPAVSEIDMIVNFEKNNNSKIIRPPHLLASLPWNEEKKYEALILEDTKDKKIINNPTTKEEIDNFFNIYNEYKNNCLQKPWISKSEISLSNSIKENFSVWVKISEKLYQNHPLRNFKDKELINISVKILGEKYKDIIPLFMHGHFSAADLIKVNNQIVLLSNLYWSYRAPFYDAVFAYHWHIYNLSSIKNVTVDIINQQRKLWLDKIYTLPKNIEEQKLLNLALLERAAAGLNLDVLSIDPKLSISEYLIESNREELKRLIKLTN